jgi:hypothetical protein
VALPAAAAALALLATLAPAPARADWLQPDPSYREAQFELRMAVRDTARRSGEPAALDTLGAALLKLGRGADAESVFRRVLALSPDDATARAGLGKLALFAGREDEAERLLAGLVAEPGALDDLYAAKLRRHDWAGAAALAPEVSQQGRVALLERLAEEPPYAIAAGPERGEALWVRSFPVPLVRVRLDGESVLMAIDTGTTDLLVDESAARRLGLSMLPGEWTTFWNGSRVAVRGAMAQRLDIAGFRVERLPAGVAKLRGWSIFVNPQGETVAGVIGLNFLRRFVPTLDYARNRLVLRRPGLPPAPRAGDERIPFETWGEAELTVYGSMAGGRRMAMVVQTGLPGCGVAAPAEVFEEVGVKAGGIARLVKSAGQLIQGRPWTEVSVPGVTVGPVSRDKVPGWLGALDSSELWRHGVRRDAVLAGEFFRGRALTIDWAKRELVLNRKP